MVARTMLTKFAIYNVNDGTYWTGKGWSAFKEAADLFAYREFAREAAQMLNDGVGMRVATVYVDPRKK